MNINKTLLEQTAKDYDLDSSVVSSTADKSDSLSEFYDRLEEEIK